MRTILILLLIYMLFRTFVKYIAPIMLKNFIEDKMNEAGRRNAQESRPEGDVKIVYKPENKNKDIDGDYVDYKEVK